MLAMGKDGRIILRCDGCRRQIRDLSKANGAFTEEAGELRLRGVFCKATCAHELRDSDTWELHHVLELLCRGGLDLRREKARRQVDALLVCL
jgi:hypothetical protein